MPLGITRPYQNNQHVPVQSKGVDDKNGDDVTSPRKLNVVAAWAFERAADGTTAVPPPPPNTRGRDPVLETVPADDPPAHR